MRVTYIHQHFNLPSEGGGSRPYQFAKRLAMEGHHVTMICGGAEPLDETIDGIHIKRMAVPYRNAMSIAERMHSFLHFMVSASVVAAQSKADVIYASSTPLTVAVPGIVGKVFQRSPMIFEVRDLWPSVPIELGYLRNPIAVWLARSLEKIAYKSADSVVALSPGMRDGVAKVAANKRIAVIPNASDIEIFNKSDDERAAFRLAHQWSDGEMIIMYAGGFGPTYQLDWVIRLAAAVKDTNIRFLLVGDGKDSEKLHTLASELGLDPTKILLGRRSKEEVAYFIASADLVLSPLKNEECLEVNSLNKVFDGLAAGRPIIVNHEGWLKDEIVDASAGWQLDRSIEKAAKQLRDIVNDQEGLQAARRNSLALARDKFDRDDLYGHFIDELKIVLRSK